jgi:uncharacterized membrane protein YdfJ with MMPL/SSD domain
VLLASGPLFAISILGTFQGGMLSGTSLLTNTQESARAANLIATELSNGINQSSTFELIFQSSSQFVTDPAFETSLEAALGPIRHDPRITSIIDPYTAAGPEAALALTSSDGHSALAIVSLTSTGSQAWSDYDDLRAKVRSGTLKVTGTGFVPINEAFNRTLESDLRRAETITVPACLLLLVLIFASVVASCLPLGIGILTIVGGLTATLFLNRFTDVSQYALNVVTLIGLGVSIDYSLFIVTRFRDELATGASREDAVAAAMATAGRAITFSGLTVAIGLSAMFFYQGTFLGSLGAAGAIVVALAVLYALTFLPALLAVIGPGIDRLQVPFLRGSQPGGLWHKVATLVMRRPWFVLLPAVGLLLAVAAPVLDLRLANGSVDILPSRIEARQGYDSLLAEFPGQADNTMQVVVYYPDGSPLTVSRVGEQYDLDRRIAGIPGVVGINSIYDVLPGLTRSDYQRLYSGDLAALPAQLSQALRASVGAHIVVINVLTKLGVTSEGAQNIVNTIRAYHGIGYGGKILVGGQTAVNVDVVRFVAARTPFAIGFVILVTYLLLFLFTGSVILPVKAVLMNLLSIGASFGALVWIFQQGHLANVLGFTPQPIDPGVPVILFSVVFGLSMDYEVLLVSRIHEEYIKTGDNRTAVADGLERSGRLITGAAAIMVTVFLAFGLAEVVIIKAIGIGLAIAVAVDSTLVRALVVPAAMRLLGDLNWWAPRHLRRLQGQAGLEQAGNSYTPSSLE